MPNQNCTGAAPTQGTERLFRAGAYVSTGGNTEIATEAPEGFEPSQRSKPLRPTERTRPASSPLEYDAVWQDRQDSNLDTRFWRPLLYHVTRPRLFRRRELPAQQPHRAEYQQAIPVCPTVGAIPLPPIEVGESLLNYVEMNQTSPLSWLAGAASVSCNRKATCTPVFPGCHLRGLWSNGGTSAHSLEHKHRILQFPLTGLEPATSTPRRLRRSIQLNYKGIYGRSSRPSASLIGFSRLPAQNKRHKVTKIKEPG